MAADFTGSAPLPPAPPAGGVQNLMETLQKRKELLRTLETKYSAMDLSELSLLVAQQLMDPTNTPPQSNDKSALVKWLIGQDLRRHQQQSQQQSQQPTSSSSSVGAPAANVHRTSEQPIGPLNLTQNLPSEGQSEADRLADEAYRAYHAKDQEYQNLANSEDDYEEEDDENEDDFDEDYKYFMGGGEQLFVCRQCGLALPDPEALQEHMREQCREQARVNAFYAKRKRSLRRQYQTERAALEANLKLPACGPQDWDRYVDRAGARRELHHRHPGYLDPKPNPMRKAFVEYKKETAELVEQCKKEAEEKRKEQDAVDMPPPMPLPKRKKH